MGELDDMYRVIATSLVDYLVYVYEDSIDHFIGLKILSPEVDIISSEKSESGDIDQGSGCNREEGCGSGRKPGAKSWPRGKAANYGDLEPLQTKGGVRFVNTGMQPRLIWSPPSIPNAQVIRYDVRIYRGIEFNGIASSRFSGLYVLSKYIRPAELVYERLGLDTNSHIIDTPLEACSWYFWTVRAGFNYLGTYRTTEWSAVEDDNRRTHMYPLRTEADDLHSGCWDRPVFYGPCDRKIFENDRICVEETQDEKASNVKAINAALK